MRQYLVVVLSCISLVIGDIEHLFMCLFLFMSSLEKDLFGSFASFWIGLFVFLLLLSCMRCLYILEIKLLSVTLFANIFSHSEGYLFILSIISFAVQKPVSSI